MGAVFIFLIGMFLIATEEMLNKNHSRKLQKKRASNLIDALFIIITYPKGK